MKHKKFILIFLCLTIFFVSLGVISATENTTTDNQNIHKTSNTLVQATNISKTQDTQNVTKSIKTSKNSLNNTNTKKTLKSSYAYVTSYNQNATYGNTAYQKGYIYDSAKVYGNVYLYIDGSYYSSKYYSGSNYYEYPTFTITKSLSVGSHSVEMDYYSYNSHVYEYDYSTLTIKSSNSIKLSTPSSIYYGSKLSENVTVYDTNNVYGYVYLYVDGSYACSKYINSYSTNGYASFTTSNLSTGSHTIKVEYYSYNNYNSIYDSKSVIVKTKPISLSMSGTTSPYYGNDVIENITVKDSNGINGYLYIYVDGSYKKSKYVYSYSTSGKYTFNMGALYRGNHTIKARYYSNNDYKSYYVSKKVNIKDSYSKITLTTTNIISKGSAITETVKLYDTANISGVIRIYVDGKLELTKYVDTSSRDLTYKLSTPTKANGKHSVTASYYSYGNYKTIKAKTYVILATIKTATFTNFKNNGVGVSKMLNSYDKLWVAYLKGYSPQSGRSNEVSIEASRDYGFKYTRLISAKVYYKQGGSYYSKNINLYYLNTLYPYGYTCLSSNQVPYKITVTYAPHYYG